MTGAINGPKPSVKTRGVLTEQVKASREGGCHQPGSTFADFKAGGNGTGDSIKVKLNCSSVEAVISDTDMPVSPLNPTLTYQVFGDLGFKAEGLQTVGKGRKK